MVDNFFTLMPQGAAADFQRIIDLKVDAANIGLHLLRWGPALQHQFPAPPLLDLD